MGTQPLDQKSLRLQELSILRKFCSAETGRRPVGAPNRVSHHTDYHATKSRVNSPRFRDVDAVALLARLEGAAMIINEAPLGEAPFNWLWTRKLFTMSVPMTLPGDLASQLLYFRSVSRDYRQEQKLRQSMKDW